MKLPYAHEVDYWKTGTTRSPAQWIELAIQQIRGHGGTNIVQATGDQDGREAFMLAFALKGSTYKIVWPVLPVWNASEKDRASARRQAATTLYHDIKARCVSATRYGDRFGFFQFKLLPNGQTIGQLADPDLLEHLPTLMTAAPKQPQLEPATT